MQMIDIENLKQLKRLRMIEWIPVSERYPNDDEDGKFLVTDSKGRVHGNLICGYKSGNGIETVQTFYRFDDDDFLFEPDVIAWANYPEPYKGE